MRTPRRSYLFKVTDWENDSMAKKTAIDPVVIAQTQRASEEREVQTAFQKGCNGLT